MIFYRLFSLLKSIAAGFSAGCHGRPHPSFCKALKYYYFHGFCFPIHHFHQQLFTFWESYINIGTA